ncbi:uncharacterized protein [Drosophila tropicalis]|uniref:uncharacterized protein n=1 Tax=Drosophila tropicalis TaxID=46794 RepID=UPI0035AB8D2C
MSSGVNKLRLKFSCLLLIAISIQAREHKLFECSVKYKCSAVKDFVWAIDEERCYLFHNRCLFQVEQCARGLSGQTELTETDRKTCKQSCLQYCHDTYKPVCCQIFQEDYISFSNECEMRNYICENERPYSYYDIGECVESPVHVD